MNNKTKATKDDLAKIKAFVTAVECLPRPCQTLIGIEMIKLGYVCAARIAAEEYRELEADIVSIIKFESLDPPSRMETLLKSSLKSKRVR